MADSGIRMVIDLRTQLEKRDSERDASYDENVTFYSGTDLKTAKKQGFLSGIGAAIGSLFAPPAEEEDSELKTPLNLIKPAVENKIAFTALPFTIRVIEPPESLAPTSPGLGTLPTIPGMPGLPQEPGMGQAGAGMAAAAPPGLSPLGGAPPGPPPPAVADWGRDLADRLECVVTSLLDSSNITKRRREVAWSLCVMDGAIIGVWPDFRNNRPRFFTRTPQKFYPVAYDPDGLDLAKALWVDEMDGFEVEARWGLKGYAGREDVKVTFLVDEEKFYTLVDDAEWAHPPVDNTIGIVPIVCVGSLGMPGMIFGGNIIKDAIPIVKEINYHMSLIDEQAGVIARPTMVIRDASDVSNFVALGKGGVIEVRNNGGVEVVQTPALPSAFWQLGATLQNWLDIITDNPAVLRGESGSSITTGKGFNSQLGPVTARLQTQLEMVTAAWRQAIKYALIMWANFPGGSKNLIATGAKENGDLFYIDADPQAFMVNGKMWTQVEVFLAAQSFLDRQGNSVELMQLYQNEGIDWDTFVDNLNLGNNLNKKRIRANIDRDRIWKAQGMAMAQAAAQSVMTANPELGAQERTNYGLERGYVGEAGPPPGPEAMMGAAPAGAPPEGASIETGMPQEAPPEGMTLGAPAEQDTAANLVGVMTEFFASIAKLKGSVWFGGDPILAPEKFASDQWSVTVWVTDPQDRGTITRAAEKAEEVYGHIKFIVGVPSPEEQAIQVAGGAPETPVGATPPETDISGNPPDLAAMFGGP